MEGDPYRISCWPSQPDVATKMPATWASKKPHAWQEALKERLQKLKKLKRNKGFIWKNYSLSLFNNLSFSHNWSSSPAISVREVRHLTALSPSSPAVVYLKTPTPNTNSPYFFILFPKQNFVFSKSQPKGRSGLPQNINHQTRKKKRNALKQRSCTIQAYNK